MQMYVLLRNVEYNGDSLIGVYASKAFAMAVGKAKDAEEQDGGVSFRVVTCTVNTELAYGEDEGEHVSQWA